MQVDHHHKPESPAGLGPPQKDEDLAAANGQVSRDNDKADTTIVADLDGQRKAFLTLRDRFAIAGWALLSHNNGGNTPLYLATRWGHGRELRDLATVEAFAVQVGAPC